jgi:hypothetical protein
MNITNVYSNMFTKLCMVIYIIVTEYIDNNTCTVWLLPKADICTSDGYFFKDRIKCMYAEGRKHYCIGIDEHLCGLRDTGNLTGYYQVECG